MKNNQLFLIGPALLPLTLLVQTRLLSAETPASSGDAVALQGQVSSWEKPAVPAVAPDSTAKTSNIIASGELSGGERIDITEFKRTSGDTVTLKFSLTNTGSDDLSLATFGDGSWYDWNLTKIYLLDLPNKKKYFVLRDSEKQPLCSRGKTNLKPGAKLALWAKFPAPPLTVSKVTIEIPEVAPFEDLTISN